MEENLFFDTSKLKYRGANVIIGKTVRIRYPELVELHDNVIIDDFTYISCGLVMQEHTFIENNCSLMGGKDYKIILGKHSAIGTHSVLFCGNLDLKSSLQLNYHRHLLKFKNNRDIVLEDHVLIGCHNTIHPGSILGEGARTSEYTSVRKHLESWGLYSGMSCRRIGNVNKQQILSTLTDYKNTSQ